jgi:hypothetical protein
MNIKNLIKSKIKDLVTTDVILANGSIQDKIDVEDPTAKFSRVQLASIKYPANLNRNVNFVRPEYNLSTIANAVLLDGYLRRSVNVFTEQILKNGYEFTSKNTQLQRHVTRRIKEIQNLTNVSFSEVISQVSRQLVTYANAYIIKVRSDAKTTYGKPFRLYGKELMPIAGLFIAEATTITIGLNDKNQITNYKQSVNGSEIIWDARDVIHLTYNKIPGTVTGLSNIISVLDDVRALRKLEEELEILGFQYSIPLYMYKVGNKDIPAAPGEIDQVRNTVNNMPAYGMLVVPGHHDVSVPTNNNSPIDIVSYINHFKQRVFSGLGVSPVAFGESSTSNRNTSEMLDLSMQAITISYQRILKSKLEMELIRELTLDGGFKNDNDEVSFNFPEIDLENQIKKETHIIAKWQNNLITRDEARIEMDYDIGIDEKNTFFELVTIAQIEATTEGSLKVAKESAAAKAISNKNQPANQHGKANAKPKIAKDFTDTLCESSIKLIDTLIIDEGYKSPLNIIKYKDSIKDEILTRSLKFYLEVSKSYIDYFRLPATHNSDLYNQFITSIDPILDSKIYMLKNIKTDDHIEGYSVLLKDLFITLEQKLQNLAKASIYKSLGYLTILTNTDACTLHNSTNIDIRNLDYKDLPPFAYGCKCDIEEESFYEFN